MPNIMAHNEAFLFCFDKKYTNFSILSLQCYLNFEKKISQIHVLVHDPYNYSRVTFDMYEK
jgi:hypothetical protein